MPARIDAIGHLLLHHYDNDNNDDDDDHYYYNYNYNHDPLHPNRLLPADLDHEFWNIRHALPDTGLRLQLFFFLSMHRHFFGDHEFNREFADRM